MSVSSLTNGLTHVNICSEQLLSYLLTTGGKLFKWLQRMLMCMEMKLALYFVVAVVVVVKQHHLALCSKCNN